MIVLDFGSGETCKNDITYIQRMIDELADIDSHQNEVFIKWQLFKQIPPLMPLSRASYLYAKEYAEKKGYETFASVFDADSLDFLSTTHPPYIKIACRPHLYWLIAHAMDYRPTIVSVGSVVDYNDLIGRYGGDYLHLLCCVAEYPANVTLYENLFSGLLHYGLSDHTSDLQLYKKYKPEVWERHYCLPDSEGPDSGSFAIWPDVLQEILS